MRWKCAALLAAGICCRATTYYVDSASGTDGNAGTAMSKPWKTLEKVNGGELEAGDRVLFKSGSVWQGQLAPNNSGAEGAPIVIGRYGHGARPRIDAPGQVDDAIRLYNVQFIKVWDLEVTNHGESVKTRRGVHIFLDNFGSGRNIVVSGLRIYADLHAREAECAE